MPRILAFAILLIISHLHASADFPPIETPTYIYRLLSIGYGDVDSPNPNTLLSKHPRLAAYFPNCFSRACAEPAWNRERSGLIGGGVSCPQNQSGAVAECSQFAWAEYDLYQFIFPVQRIRQITKSCPTGASMVGVNGQALCRCDIDHREEDNACHYVPHKEMSEVNLGADCRAEVSCGNPIRTGSGNKFQKELHYQGAGSNRLAFLSYYNSLASSNKWRHSYSQHLKLSADSGSRVLVIRDTGQVFTTYPNRPDLGNLQSMGYQLEKTGSGWKLNTPDDTTEIYDANGRLLELQARDGYKLIAQSGADGQILSIADTFGRRLQFAYDAKGKLLSVTTPANQSIRFEHDEQGRFVSVSYPDETSRRYFYEDPRFPEALTGLEDEGGKRFAEWRYDANGMATQSMHAGGSSRVTVSYLLDGETEVSSGAGVQYRMKYTQHLGRLLIAELESTCDGCKTNTQRYTYDSAGHLATLVDGRGVRTQLEHDPRRGLETRRVEAVDHAEAREVITAWHPTFALPLRIKEPGRHTVFDYEANGNLRSKTIVEGLGGKTYGWQWTYDSFNRRTTATDPAGRLTRYSYDAAGNLASIVDPAGLATHFTAYDADGQPLSITRPDGVIVTLCYDLRGRLIEQQTGTLKTAYRYTPTGLLDRVTTPDGKQLSYVYDDAHRLIEVRDNQGNRISYQRDPMGNVLREEIQDVSGTLSALNTQIQSGLSTTLRSIQ